MITAVETHDCSASLRRTTYFLLAAVSIGMMFGRILAVDSVDMIGLEKYRLSNLPNELKLRTERWKKEGLAADLIETRLSEAEGKLREQAHRLRRPFLSANDRSRWCTIRALVEEEFRVENAPYAIDKVIQEQGWDTIDMVKHDGHLYSSKPTLFPTMLAGEYWLIQKATGETLGTNPYGVGRAILITVNVIPLAVMFWLLARLIERLGRSDSGRILAMAVATLGTFLTTFSVVLNNHVPGAACATVALYASVRIWFDGERRVRYFFVTGLFAAMAVAMELPALSLLAALAAALAWKAPKQTLLGLAPAVVLVTVPFFATNWIAHDSLRPPYMHRSEANPEDNWYKFTYMRGSREIRSYWQEPVGVDRGEPSRALYVLHTMVGHHGLFSLTPIWLLTVVGLGIWLVRPQTASVRQLALLIAALSLVCIVFYLKMGQQDRNYGGMTCGLRWLFWLAPLWVVALVPAADWLGGRRWGMVVAGVLLAFSVLSVTYPTWNPWVHPWIYDYLGYLGVLG